MRESLISWIEIPVTDMDRAKAFYEKVFDIEISINDFGGFLMGWFPSLPNAVATSGALVKHEMYKPSISEGPLLYFTCKDVSIELDRIASIGGEVLQPKTAIGEGHGFMALFKDSEGNRMALHSNS